MNFEDGTVESIRSISQRGLAAAWARLASQGLPAFDQFHPRPRVHDPKQLVVWKVEAAPSGFEFRALYRGQLVDEAFNEGWAGKTLTEVTPSSLRPVIVSASNHCVSTGCAIYTILRTKDDAGYPVDLERLLLPFGDKARVQIILASLQLNSIDVTLERLKVVKHFEMQLETKLSLRISAARFNHCPSKPLAVGGMKPKDYTAAQNQVAALNRSANLKDATVNRFAVGREYGLVIAALSLMSEVEIEHIEPLLGADRLNDLIVACKASSLSWPTTAMIIRNRPRCPPASDWELQQGLYMFEALSLSVAQQTLRFWSN